MCVKPKISRALVTGASGMLGTSLCAVLRRRGVEIVGQSNSLSLSLRNKVDIGVKADFSLPGAAASLVRDYQPDVVFNCAAMTDVDQCQALPDQAFRLNSEVCGELAVACAEVDSKFVMFSTDQLWVSAGPFIPETTIVDPPNVYAETKVSAEAASRVSGSELLVRTNFFGAATERKESAVQSVANRLRQGLCYQGFRDVYYTPIAAELLSEIVMQAVLRDLHGTYNIVGKNRVSKLEFSREVANYFGLNTDLIGSISVDRKKFEAFRPKEMSLSVDKIETALGFQMPTLRQSLSAGK